MTNEERLIAALEYQRAMQPAFGNPNLMRQGQRMNLPARQIPGPVSAFGTQAVSFDQQPDQGYGTMAAEMALGFVPGVGQAMAVRDIERARRDNDPLGMALAGLSLVPFGKMIGAMRGRKQVGPVSQLDVYHGSPYKFDKFDASKIGTGEGAQAYGHGLYFAENPSVAGSYRSSNAMATGTPEGHAAGIVGMMGGEAKGLAHLKSILPPKGQTTFSGESHDLIASAIKSIEGGTYKKIGEGSLYKVDLPDAQIAKMLDWDKPFSNQSPDVQDLIATIGEQRLQQAGIPGIRYLDGGSRAGGKGTSNFVVFPGSESMLTILERNNQNVGNMMKQTVPAPSLMYKDPFGATY